MKLLAFVDLHMSKRYYMKLKKKAKHADLILCAGDITIFRNGQDFILKKLDQLKKPMLMIHGNHEAEMSLRKSCRRTKNIEFIHKKLFKKDNLVVIGYGGGGFSMVDGYFSRFGNRIAKKIEKLRKKNKELKIILLTHAPPFGTKVDKVMENYCGNKSMRIFIQKVQPDYSITGHLHENFGKMDKIGKTVVMNPGPGGKVINIKN